MDDKLSRALADYKKRGGKYRDALHMLSSTYIAKPRDAEIIAGVQAKVAQQAVKRGSG